MKSDSDHKRGVLLEPDVDWPTHDIGEGRFVYLAADHGDDASAYDENMNEIGNATFICTNEDDDSYVVAGIHVEDDYQGRGIATALIVEFAKQNNDAAIYFRPDTGQTSSDGTHLTISGVILARSMIGKGLAFWLPGFGGDDCPE